MIENVHLNKSVLESFNLNDASNKEKRNYLRVKELIWDFSFKTEKKYERVIVADWY